MFVVEAFHAAMFGAPRGEGISPDLVWQIERHLQSSAVMSENDVNEAGVQS